MTSGGSYLVFGEVNYDYHYWIKRLMLVLLRYPGMCWLMGQHQKSYLKWGLIWQSLDQEFNADRTVLVSLKLSDSYIIMRY